MQVRKGVGNLQLWFTALISQFFEVRLKVEETGLNVFFKKTFSSQTESLLTVMHYWVALKSTESLCP